MNSGGVWQRVVAASIVAISFATVWLSLATWGVSIWESATRFASRAYESVTVALDGTPLIQSQSGSDYRDVSYRSLDGKPVEIEREEWLGGASLARPIRPPGLFRWPIGWGQVMGTNDSGRPSVAWYLIRDNKTHGHAYFVGYDELSRALVGYIGRKGFRRAPLPSEEWFDLGQRQLSWGSGAVASSGYLQFGSRSFSYGAAAEEMRVPMWQVFLLDGQQLMEIDLREKSVRTLYESPDLISVSVLYEAPPAVQPSETPASSERPKPIRRVALRSRDQIVVLDPPTDAKTEYPLPQSLADKYLTVYGLAGDQILLQWQPEDNPRRNLVELAWLETDGTFAREEHVKLAGYPPPNERQGAWIAAAVAPIPIGWTAVLGVVAPLSMVQVHQAAGYREASAKLLGMAWPAFVAVILVGALLAWWTLRSQRKYHRPATGVWCAFVFLLGVPGMFAYWLEHRRAKLETCGECGQVVPRDRDACAACQTPFPAPPSVGTEIFA